MFDANEFYIKGFILLNKMICHLKQYKSFKLFVFFLEWNNFIEHGFNLCYLK